MAWKAEQHSSKRLDCCYREAEVARLRSRGCYREAAIARLLSLSFLNRKRGETESQNRVMAVDLGVATLTVLSNLSIFLAGRTISLADAGPV